jgi:integrase
MVPPDTHQLPAVRRHGHRGQGLTFGRGRVVGASSHSGRRWFMTELARGGVRPRIIQQRAGHTSLATTQRYIEVTPDQERRAPRVLKF